VYKKAPPPPPTARPVGTERFPAMWVARGLFRESVVGRSGSLQMGLFSRG